MPVAQIDRVKSGGSTTDVPTYLYTDHLGTPRLGTNSQGTLVWRNDGDAFATTAPNEDPDQDRKLTTVNLRFAGQYYDQETGLHYNWNRYYDPRSGRYITSDPIGLPGGLNTYAYVANNPLRFIDPIGLKIVGSWIQGPGLADANASLQSIELLDLAVRPLPPGISLALVTLGVSGTVQAVVYCKDIDDCSGDVRRRWVANPTQSVSGEFSFHVPYRVGPWQWSAIWAVIDAAMTGYQYKDYLNLLASPIIAEMLARGPTFFCLGNSSGQ